MTVILVLAVLAMTLAVAYASLRSQTVAAHIQNNGQLRSAARQAALVGLAVGLRKMHESGWTGVGTSHSGQLSSTQSYTVSWIQGDTALQVPGSDMSEWPYRVTVRATGTAADPSLGTTAAWQAEAVVRLVPRALSAQPVDWSTMVQYTVYQTDKKAFVLEVPCHVRGSLWVKGQLQIAQTYPSHTQAHTRYMSDLNLMRLAGQPDYRPLSGPVYLEFDSGTSTTDRTVVATHLGVTIIDVASKALGGWTYPGTITQYRLYPGGTLYTVPTVGTKLSNVSLLADPVSNPLGIFRSTGAVTVEDNVVLRGTLLCADRLDVTGKNVDCASVAQPALYNTSAPVHVPVCLVAKDANIGKDAAATFRGLIATWGKLATEKGHATTLSIEGKVFATEFRFDFRSAWDLGPGKWGALWNKFLLVVGRPYFPEWLRGEGLPPEPLLTVVPESSSLVYHWLGPTDPIYRPAEGDGGLRWDVLRRRDFP